MRGCIISINDMLTDEFKSIPNLLSLIRLLLVPILWVFAVLDMPVYVGVGLIATGLTDVLDGYVARRWGLVTEYGSKLDSIADVSVIASTVIWVILLTPGIFLDHAVLISLWVGIEASAIAVGWIKFRRIANLHLYSAKVGGVAGYTFVVVAFIFGYNELLFYIAFAAVTVSSIEALMLFLLCSSVDEHMKSIAHVYRKGKLV